MTGRDVYTNDRIRNTYTNDERKNIYTNNEKKRRILTRIAKVGPPTPATEAAMI